MPEEVPCGEVLKKTLRTKQIYHYVDKERGINVRSRDVFLNRLRTVHYPFRPSTGRPKYKNNLKITYESVPEPLPSGFLKVARTGYGFHRDLSPLLFVLYDALPQLNHVIVSSSLPSQVNGETEVVLNLKDLNKARPNIHALNSEQREEMNILANNILVRFFPDNFTQKTVGYQKGQLSNFLISYTVKSRMLSKGDFLALSSLFSTLPLDHEYVRSRGVLDSKESFDRIYIEDITQRYRDLLKQKTDTDTLEARWQEFFRDNILYFNFGYVERFEKERIQGDKKLNIPDFILLNIYGYLDIFEIKTHLTQLLRFDDGRKNFFWSTPAAQAISQAENYIDSLIKVEDTIIKNIRDEYAIHNVNAVRPVVYIIASSKPHIAGKLTSQYRGGMRVKMWNDFRRLNNSLKNISFVPYDELLNVFSNMLSRLKASELEKD